MKKRLRVLGGSEVSGGDFYSLWALGGIEIHDDFSCGKGWAMGGIECGGNLSADRLRVIGGMEIKGFLKVKKLFCVGALEAKSTVEGEYIRIGGAIEAPSVNADILDMRLGGQNKLDSIGAREVRVRKGKTTINQQQPELIVDTIEADIIHLTHTTAKVVRGDKVVIGSNCRIELVEYRTSLTVEHGSVVTKQTKI